MISELPLGLFDKENFECNPVCIFFHISHGDLRFLYFISCFFNTFVVIKNFRIFPKVDIFHFFHMISARMSQNNVSNLEIL